MDTDPAFVDKVRDIVGLYVEPLARAAVLSIDGKSQIQAVNRTQPGLRTASSGNRQPISTSSSSRHR